jgi:hypothetical protein
MRSPKLILDMFLALGLLKRYPRFALDDGSSAVSAFWQRGWCVLSRSISIAPLPALLCRYPTPRSCCPVIVLLCVFGLKVGATMLGLQISERGTLGLVSEMMSVIPSGRECW